MVRKVMSSHPFSSWKTQIVTGRLEYKNEILAAFMDSMMIAHVPDLIGVVDVTGMPLQNTRYEQGTEVIVYTVPAPAIWQVGKGRQVFDLKHFGY